MIVSKVNNSFQNTTNCMIFRLSEIKPNGQVYAKWAVAGFKLIKPLQF